MLYKYLHSYESSQREAVAMLLNDVASGGGGGRDVCS